MPASLIDSNVWVAASFPSHPFHARAVRVLEAATAEEPVAFCRATQASFLRLATTPQLLRQYGAANLTNRDAIIGLEIFLSHPAVRELDEPPGTPALWHQLATRDSAAPRVWMDAYLAAFAIAGGLRLVSLDRDFRGYEPNGLRLVLLNS